MASYRGRDYHVLGMGSVMDTVIDFISAVLIVFGGMYMIGFASTIGG